MSARLAPWKSMPGPGGRPPGRQTAAGERGARRLARLIASRIARSWGAPSTVARSAADGAAEGGDVARGRKTALRAGTG